MDDSQSWPPGPASEENAQFMNPINLLFVMLLAVVVFMRFRTPLPSSLPGPQAPIVFKTFTPRTLLPYNGLDGMPVYLAVNGHVFDVTAGKNFYGPKGPYANFAGRDASRGLAMGSFDEEMLTQDLDGPLDGLHDLDDEQREALKGWEERFNEKYIIVGDLVPVGHPKAEERAEVDVKAVEASPIS